MFTQLLPPGPNRRTWIECPPPFRRRALRGCHGRGDRGAQFVEFAAYLPIFLVVLALAMETFAAFLALERLGNAARTGARVAAESGPTNARQAAADSLPPWLDDATVTVETNSKNGYYTEVRVAPPFIFATADLNIALTRRVDMPNL